MKKKKKSNMIIGGEIEFVSLVRNGANRTPFKAIKSDQGGIDMPTQVVQRVVVPKTISDEATEKALDGFRTDDVEEEKNFKSYIQVPIDAVDPDTIQLAKHETGVYMIVGELIDGKEEELDEVPNSTEKEELDWATLDDMYTEMYALEGIVSGALRQKSSDMAEKMDTILKAIDNFRASVEIILANVKFDENDVPMSDKKEIETIKSIVEETIEKSVSGTIENLQKELDDLKEEMGATKKSVEEVSSTLAEASEKTEKAESESAEKLEELGTTVKSLQEEIDVLKKQPKGKKSGDQDPQPAGGKKREGITHKDDYFGRRY